MRFLAIGLAVVVLAAAAVSGWIWHSYRAPGPLEAPVNVVVPRGAGVAQIAEQLRARGAIDHPLIFRIGALVTGAASQLKAGEFALPARVSAQQAAAIIASGKTVVRRLTIAEGTTTAQAVALLRDAEGLEGEIGSVPGEGELLPETYFYSWGDSRERLLQRQRRAMTEALAELWPKRVTDLPIRTPEEAVILASIVEKETAVPDERPQIAAVFLNRLKRGMRLQADPTVIYGLTEGKTVLDRPLSRADLETRHPWNTYVIGGLPPTPIANPGRASLEAVLRPADTADLYFVSDGTGRHVFARSLAEHNRNVQRLRQVERERAKPPQ